MTSQPIHLLEKCICLTIIATLLSALSACDGGLFGTGDGGTIKPIPIITNGDSFDQEADGQGDTYRVPNIAFENLLVGSTDIRPRLALINLSSRSLNIARDGDITTLFTTSTLPGERTQAVPLPLGESLLNIVDTNANQTVFTFESLNAGASSITTLVARNPLTGSTANPTSDKPLLDIITLRTMASNDTEVAQVRVVQVNLLGDFDDIATMSLVPEGTQPGGSEVSFTNITASTAIEANYSPVGAGSYRLVDSMTRFEPVSVTVDAGSVYTVFIISNTHPVTVIQKDSDFDTP